ncbi:MAG: hypothetical protein ABIN48_01295 [Ginsengibacter sp.]
MKSFIKSGVFFLIVLLQLSIVNAQDNSRYQLYYIHEDPVYPSMIAPYEKLAINLATECKKVNLPDGWLTLNLDNNRYQYVTPINSMADLDKNTFAPLQTKMGNEAFTKMFTDFDKCYDSHRDFIVRLDKQLSYMPGGIDIYTDGMPYRHFTYYYVTPQNIGKATELAKAFHDLYTKKGSKVQYRVYRNGFGEQNAYFMVVVSAKSAEDYEKRRAENRELLGDEGKELYGKLLQITSEIKNITGMIRPDLSYRPGK